ncbi:MAG: UbiA family prenyltransferase [bacterium]|nr:UbiA family prenyltransferase [bacterium]
MQPRRHPLDWFFVLRPTLLFPVCTVFLAGVGFHGTRFSYIEWSIFVICSIAMGGSVYLLNEVKDIPNDVANQKNLFLPQQIFTPITIKRFALVLAIFGLSGLAFIGKSSFAIIAFGFLITGVLYNFPPFRWKDKPLPSLFVAMLAGFLIFAAGSLMNQNGLLDLIRGVPYLFAFAGVSLWTQIPDETGDRDSGKNTFCVIYGKRTTAFSGWLFVVAAACFALLLVEWVLFVSAMVTLVVAIPLLKELNAERAGFSARIAIVVLSFLIGCCYPLYLVTIIVYYFVARRYYQLRFAIVYPSISGNKW